MATPALADSVKSKIRELRGQGLTQLQVARKLKVSAGSVSNVDREHGDRASYPAEVGRPIDNRGPNGGETSIISPDKPKTVEEMAKMFGIDLTEWVPDIIRTNEWQGFYKLNTENSHKKVCLYQTRITWKRIVTTAVQKALTAFSANHIKALPALPRSKTPTGDCVVSWGLWDAHLGMYAWAPEVGDSFDLTMATNRVMNSIDDMVTELKPYGVKKIWMPVGNDFMHFDNARHTTTRGDHFLDTDTRYAKVYEACLTCLSYMIERGMEIAKEVEVIHIPGNHDMTSSYTLCVALQQRYLKSHQVSVDASPNPRKYRKHGGVLLGFDHGEADAKQLALIFAAECAKDWSDSVYREIQVGHTHQRRERMFENLVPTNGILVRTNPSLCNVDAWHHRQGFIGEPVKSVEAYRYDSTGFRGSHVTWARDDQRSPTKK